MNNTYSSWLPYWLRYGLGMLALLTTIRAAQAQPSAPAGAPTVTTDEVTNVGAGRATVVGTLTSTGSTALTDYGVVYVQGTGTPTISDSKIPAGFNSPAVLPSRFSATLSVAPATTYTARAYATNSSGTSYGNSVLIGPVVSRIVSIDRLNSSPTNNSTVTYAITLSIPVEGLTLNNFALSTTGNITGASIQSLQSTGTIPTYSAQYFLVANTGTGDGTLTLYLANYQGTRPGIASPIPTPGTPTYVIDKTLPTTIISTTASNPTSSALIPFTVTFSESVQNFTAADIVVTNGTVTSALTNVGNAYNFTVTPTVNGLVTVNVPANVASDAANNPNTAAASVSLTYVAPTPVTTWTGAVSSNWFTEGNWTGGIPTTKLSAFIPGGVTRYPVLGSGTASANNLILDRGATLTQRGGTLALQGNLTNNGTFAATGGTVATKGSTPQTLGGSSPLPFYGLSIGSAGAAQATRVSFQDALTLTGNLTTNGQALTLLSRVQDGVAYDGLVVNNGGVVVGNTTVQRAIDPSLNSGLGYRHYSSPVANTTVADLATTGFTPVLNDAYNSSPTPNSVTPFPTVFGYDQALVNRTNATPAFDKGFFSPMATSAPLVPGRGYNVNLRAAELVDFVGTLNNGPISVAMSRNALGTLNAADAGWQFLGNPYPAPLDYSRVAPADRPGLEDAIYVYSSTSQYGGQYRAYLNGIGGNPVIPIAQGFFARLATPGTSATFTFRNSQRLTGAEATAFQRAAADPRPVVQLELGMAAGPTDVFYAYAQAGATPAFDAAFDAPKLPNRTGLNLASLAGSERLAIDGRAAFTAATTIPLALDVPAAGTYSLRAAAPPTLPAGLSAYLADRQTGQTVALAGGARYTFTVTAGQASAGLDGRFVLQFAPAAPLAPVASLGEAQVTVYPNPTHERFTVQVPAVADAANLQAELFNSLGQAVRRHVVALPAAGTTLTVETTGLAAGVYVLHLQAGSSTLAKRVVVN